MLLIVYFFIDILLLSQYVVFMLSCAGLLYAVNNVTHLTTVMLL